MASLELVSIQHLWLRRTSKYILDPPCLILRATAGPLMGIYLHPPFPISMLIFLLSTGAYTIAEAEGVSRGTKIVLELRDNAQEFGKKKNIESTLIRLSGLSLVSLTP